MRSLQVPAQDCYLYLLGIYTSEALTQPHVPPCLAQILKNLTDPRRLRLSLQQIADANWNAMARARQFTLGWAPASTMPPFGLPAPWWHIQIQNYPLKRPTGINTEDLVAEASAFFQVSETLAYVDF